MAIIITAVCLPASIIAQQKPCKSKRQEKKEKKVMAKMEKKQAMEQRLACF